MAEVWSATNTLTDRQFAIKFINPDVMKSKEAAARFMKEAKVSARINHPNVIDVIDVGQMEDGRLFMVMELLTGVPLEVALHRQNPPMSLHEFAFVMVEVARALAAAHRAGVVHRDLKPTNIFLHKERSGAAVPKLLDFGVSKFLEDDQNHALTIAGTVLGSPLYMSPEQARGDVQIDHRSDIFSFGAILFEALAGFRPVRRAKLQLAHRDDRDEVAKRHRRKRPQHSGLAARDREALLGDGSRPACAVARRDWRNAFCHVAGARKEPASTAASKDGAFHARSGRHECLAGREAERSPAARAAVRAAAEFLAAMGDAHVRVHHVLTQASARGRLGGWRSGRIFRARGDARRRRGHAHARRSASHRQ